MNKRIAALILAAGSGGRIGMPKWRLEFEGKTFLDIICDKLVSAQLMDVICIKREDFKIGKPLLKYANNPTPKHGMISSVYYGVKAYPDYESYLIWPVDHPFVEVSTIVELKNLFEFNREKVVRPNFNCITGHPIIIPHFLTTYLQTPNYSGGLRQLIKDSKSEIFDLSVNDPSVLRNINLMTDLGKIKFL
jgi:CTP:molybdopterin cytidylyltransferase MocA